MQCRNRLLVNVCVVCVTDGTVVASLVTVIVCSTHTTDVGVRNYPSLGMSAAFFGSKTNFRALGETATLVKHEKLSMFFKRSSGQSRMLPAHDLVHRYVNVPCTALYWPHQHGGHVHMRGMRNTCNVHNQRRPWRVLLTWKPACIGTQPTIQRETRWSCAEPG